MNLKNTRILCSIDRQTEEVIHVVGNMPVKRQGLAVSLQLFKHLIQELLGFPLLEGHGVFEAKTREIVSNLVSLQLFNIWVCVQV